MQDSYSISPRYILGSPGGTPRAIITKNHTQCPGEMSVPVQNFSQIRSAVCLFGLFETHLLPNRQTNSEFIISSLRWRDNWLLYALQHIHSVRASVDQRSLLSTYKSSGSRDRTQWYRVYLLVCRTKRQRGMVCSTVRISRWLCRTATRSASAGMGSSSTVLELEDSSRTQNRGLGLDASASITGL